LLLLALAQARATENTQRVPISPPDETTIPAEPIGEAIRYGERLAAGRGLDTKV